MNSSLSIDHSSVNEKLNMTDYLHQIRIGLKTNPLKDEVCNFLKESMKHLDNNFDTNLANELFTTITSCFSRYPNDLLNFFDDIYQKSKTNSNYFILSIFIINELYHNQININDYKSLISDSLKEILPQIQSKFLEKFLKIFDVEIPHQFQNDLIIDLINCSNLNEDVIFEVFPYIIANNIKSQNQKINSLQEKIEKFDFNKILELNNISNQEIFEFINTKNYELLSGFNKSSLSILISAFIYIKSHGKIKIKGLNKDNILQFTSILIIFLECQQNYQPFSNSDINDCLKDEIKSLKSKNSIILDKFNEFILSNYSILLHYQLLSYNDLLQVIEVMTQQIPNKTISLNILFELSNQIQFTNKQFFKDFNDEIKNLKESLFNNIVSNLIYINNNYDGLKNPKFNLESVDSSTICNLLENSKSFDEISNILYFIDNLCSNHFNITTSNDFSNCLKKIYEDNLNLEKSSNSNLIQNYINKFKIKKSNEINKEKTINDIIEYILNEQNPETNDNLFEILFDKMMENQQLSENFIGFCLNKDTDLSYEVDDFLKIHLLEYINYQDCFIKMTNKRYFYIGKNRILTLNPNYRTSNLEITDIGTSIVETLFDKIDQQPNNFQAFFILKNIASSFPNIFLKNYQQVFDNVLRSFDSFYLIYEKNLTNEQLQMAKTSYSAFSFLLSTFQSSLILDEFTKWLFTNISNFSNSQIIGFISIIILCLIDTKISFIINTYITKYNFLEILGNLINRNLENCSYKNVYLELIYLLVNQIYDTYTKYNENVSVQIEEFTNIDNPFNYIFEISFNCFPYCFLSEKIRSNRLNHQISKFIDNTNRPRKFWLNYTIDKKQNRVNLDQVNNFISKLPKYEPYLIPSYVKKFEDKFTIKMIRNLVLKSYLIYGWFLYPKYTHFIQETGELIVNAFMDLNDILNETDNNNEEDQNIKTYDVSEYLFQYYCQPNLIENLFNQTNLGSIDNKCFSSLCKAIYILSQNDVCLLSILEIISNCIEDSIANESISSKRTMYRLVDVLILISKSECFEQNFFDLCQNYLINAALSLNYRNDSKFIMKVTNLFSFLNIDFSSPIKNLIEVILTMDNIESIELLIKLYSKFDNVKSTNFQELSYYAFDKEIKKSQNTKIIIDLINYYPSLTQEKYTDLLSFLDDQLHKFFKTEQKLGKPLNDICFLFNKLAPKRGDFPNLIESEENEYIIPQEFVEKSPQFWQLFGKYREKIDKMIEEDLNILDKLYFIIDFPELIKFNIRSSLIKKLLKSKIKFSTIKLRVDFDNILASSYIQLHNKSPNQLLNDIEICIPNSIVHDTGGVKREWFTKLAKEIFNQNYGLFDCSEKTMSYQPSPNSYIHPNHIEYFRFIGQFVARSLIEGICIDAHFTPSFCKQILHYKLDINDLKDVDEELYHSSEWILQNDVDPLDLYFEIDTNELGENKTVPLKENGSEIKVTNENKKEFIQLRTDYVLFNRIEKQVNAFREGFESLIDYDTIKVFTPKELDLLIVGSQEFDVKDFIDHFSYDYPFTEETPVVKLFFNAISKWNKDDLQKLLMFMTGSSRVPINGFDEFCKMSGKTFKIGSGGDKSNLPQSHTCANTINLPQYETEDELNEKLHMAINECITYENV